MPSVNKTPNIGLNQWEGNEYPKRVDFNEDNLKVDTAIQAIHAEKAQPNGLATLGADGKVPSTQLPTIEVPVTSVNSKTGNVVLTASDVGAAPSVHGHVISDVTGLQSALDTKETPAGAQAKVNALAGVGNTKTVKQVADEITTHTTTRATETTLGHVKAKTSADGTLLIPIGILNDTRNYKASLEYRDITKQVDLTPWLGKINAMAFDNDYIYATTEYKYIIRFNKSNLSEYITSSTYNSVKAIAVDEQFIYVVKNLNYVAKLNKSDLTEVATSVSFTEEIKSIIVDNSYVYISLVIIGKMYKLSKSNLTKVAESSQYGITYDMDQDSSYIYSSGSHDNVIKISKSTLAIVAESVKLDGYTTYGLTTDDSYAYFYFSAGNIVKLKKSDLSNVFSSTMSYKGYIRSLSVYENDLYVGAGYLYKLNKEDFSIIKYNYTKVYGMLKWINADSDYVYIGNENTGIDDSVVKLGGTHIKELIRVV